MADNDDGATVPSSRLREETTAKREALDRAARLENELASERAKSKTAETLSGQVTSLQKQLDDTKAEHTKAAAAWNEERAVFGLGITDPEAVSVARHLHSQLPEAGRPSLPDWLKGLQAAPATAPKSLQGWLPAPQAGQGGGAGGAGAGAAGGAAGGEPRNMGANRGSQPAAGPAVGGDLSLEAAKKRISDLAAEATKTKDWTAYNAERAGLLARIARG